MEASETVTETPEPANEPQPLPTEQSEPASETTEAPDIGEALQEIRAFREEMQERVPKPEPEEPQHDFMASLLGELEEEPTEGEPAPEAQPATQDELQALREMMREEAEAAFMPHLQRQEYDRRVSAIEKFADEHPRIREEKVTNAITERLRPLAARYGKGVYTDPDLVIDAYKAYEADAAAIAQGSSEDEQHPANLEQGGGAAVPEPEVSPDEQMYARALQQTEGTDPLTR